MVNNIEFIETSIMPDGQIETLVKVDGEYKMIPSTLQPPSIGFELTGDKHRVKDLDVYGARLVADRTVDREEIKNTFVGQMLLGTEKDREIVGVELFCISKYAPGMGMGIAVKHGEETTT
jgi:hypothetical protein